MSFFFDVWTCEGFVLAGDVRVTVNGASQFGHKLFAPSSGSRVVCAMAACGDYFEACGNFFIEATSAKDSLRDVARAFAEKWTGKFARTENYSAVHLVGYQQTSAVEGGVPQLWYWTNWHSAPQRFYGREFLQANLSSFSDPIPKNNHIPHKILEETGKFPNPDLDSEARLVQSFLTMHEPYFTWNGDTAFWRGATDAVGSALNILTRRKGVWKIEDTAKLAEACLGFLANLGELLPESTVGLSPSKDFDVITVCPSDVKQVRWAEF